MSADEILQAITFVWSLRERTARRRAMNSAWYKHTHTHASTACGQSSAKQQPQHRHRHPHPHPHQIHLTFFPYHLYSFRQMVLPREIMN